MCKRRPYEHTERKTDEREQVMSLDEVYRGGGWATVPLHVSLGMSMHSATCHLWVWTTRMEKGIWHMGQKSPEDGPSAPSSFCSVSWAGDDFEGRWWSCKLPCTSTSMFTTTVLLSPLPAVLTFLPGDLSEVESLLEAFLDGHLLLAAVAGAGGGSRRFFFFSRGLYSQMSFSESFFCDIWSKNRSVPHVTQPAPRHPRYYTTTDV